MIGTKLWKSIYSKLFSPQLSDEELESRLSAIKNNLPTPVFWLIGKPQSGKTSIIKALTGDSRAIIGNGMQPCTKSSLIYSFPDASNSFVNFLDTRGIGEIDYEPNDDLITFSDQAQILIVVMKAMDHAQGKLMEAVYDIHKKKPDLPIIVVQTLLHEGYPDKNFEHIHPYPYDQEDWETKVPDDLRRSLQQQRNLFKDLDARFVAIDLTHQDDGYLPINYGIEAFWHALEIVLPEGIVMMLHEMKELRKHLADVYGNAAHPHIVAYALLSGASGAIPVPFVDIPAVTVIQAKLLHTIASIYNFKLTRKKWAEISSALGISFLLNFGRREMLKFIPLYGAAASSVLTAATTYALGKSLTLYFQSEKCGQALSRELFRVVYKDQFEQGKTLLKNYVVDLNKKNTV